MKISETEKDGSRGTGHSITKGIYLGTQAYHVFNSDLENKKWYV